MISGAKLRFEWIAVPAISALLLGCGGGSVGDSDQEPTVPVTGTVMYNGAPVADATVSFQAQDSSGKSAFGKTDAEGKYELTTYEPGDGAIPGEYKITVTKHEAVEATQSGTANPSEEPEDYVPPTEGEPEPAPTSLLPEKYADAASSGLSETVSAEGPNEFNFELTD